MKSIILLSALFVTTGLFAAGKSEVVKHKIEAKETLFRVSLMYNSTVKDILEANPGLTPQSTRIGMTVKVPKDTKIRDAAFVESFLNPEKIEYIPISQLAQEIKHEKAEEPVQAAAPAKAEIKTEAPVAVKPVAVQPVAQKEIMDENPFLTPSEPRTAQIYDEQPIKANPITEPSTASHETEEDENPFVTPKKGGNK